MSAFANPSAPPAAPPGVTPQPVPPALGRRPRKIWLIVALVALAVLAGVFLIRSRQQQQKAAPAIVVRTVKATRGPMQRVLRIAGTTSAKNFANVVAPMMRGPDAGRALVLIYLAKSGTLVKKGDVIAQIDAQTMKDHVDDVNAQVQQADADIRKRKAEQAIELENLAQNLRVAKANLDKAKLEYGAQEIRTPIDQELLKLTVEETQAQYSELQKDIKNKQIAHAAELRILELTRDRHGRHRDRHKFDVERFTIHASMSGLAVMQSLTRSGEMAQIQVGDQVAPGQPFMKIVDPGSMQVDAAVNQVESEQIRLGQRARINFDAFPDLHLSGKVQAVGALAIGGWRVNYYIRNIPVRIQIEGSDPRVIPDLSASANVVLESKDDVISVPEECVHTSRGKHLVYVKEGDRIRPREVQLGMSNGTRVAIIAGVQAGEEIALQKPNI